jgi:CRP-like cAMP-binding protein
METGALGRLYSDGEIIFRQTEPGDCLYVVQDGEVEIFLEKDDQEVPLRLCRAGDFLGEMALFNSERRSATARSRENTRLLTIDRKNFLRRIQEDPTIAFRLVQALSGRIRDLDAAVAVLSRALRECLSEKFA